MRKASFVGAVAMLASLLLALPASAATLPTEGFEGFNPVTPLQPIGGWAYTGGSQYDVGITSTGINGQSVRISNATMSGSFGDWLFSPAIAPATEGGSQEFTATFDIKSATGQYQPGLQASVAPQTTGGARMSFLKFTDTPGGIVVSFADVLNPSETIIDDSLDVGENWREVNIATLDYTNKHTVTIKMNLLPGPHNDVVQVYIDDINGGAGLVPGRPAGNAQFAGFFAPVDNPTTVNKAKAGQTIPLKWTLNAQSFATSWEDYYRYNSESNAGTPSNLWTTRQVDSLIFQARCAPDDQQQTCKNESIDSTDDQEDGYYFDNVTYSSGAIVTPLPIATNGVGDPSVYGPQPFSQHVEDCVSGADLDPIETYTSNTGGLMYHGNGVWQYNWQTPKAYAGKCVELTLNLGDYTTLFQFTK
jgi:hypothetical protein